MSSSPDIGIIGQGRFGTYFAGQLERAGYRTRFGDLTAPLVMYAVPIRSLEGALVETRSALGPDTIVMDVCSVKMIPCELLLRHLPGRPAVGTHPLFGPDSSPVSCAGQRAALCALPGGERAAACVEQVYARLGLNIVRCTPAEHDTQVARSQFLTHFIGRGAVRAGIERLALSTRTHEALMDIVDVVGHDSMELFEDMAAFNPMVPEVRANFLAALRAIDAQLATSAPKSPTATSTPR
jgi:prephenate dehydrogenase